MRQPTGNLSRFTVSNRLWYSSSACCCKLYIYHNTQIAAIHTLSDQRINYDLSHYTEALRESLNEDEIEKKAIENLELLKGIGTTYE